MEKCTTALLIKSTVTTFKNKKLHQNINEIVKYFTELYNTGTEQAYISYPTASIYNAEK